MPWIARQLRGQRVLARCDESGTLRAVDGRVEIRYRPEDPRAYRASLANLVLVHDAEVLPDDHCAEIGAEATRESHAPAARGAPPSQAQDDLGARPSAAAAPRTRAKAAPKKVAPEAASADAASKSGGREPASGTSLTVYADGACSGNPGPAGLGVVIYDDDGKRELSEFLGHATNNIAELTAILRAAEALRDETRPIVLKTDSQYSIGVLTKGWKAKANAELIATVKAALSHLPHMKLRYVEGHAGHAGNERADELARAAVSARRTSGWKHHAKLAT